MSRLFFALILLLVGGRTAAGQELGPLVLAADQSQYPLGLHLAILEDQEGTLTIDDVTSPDVASQFVPSQKMTPAEGFTNSAYWIDSAYETKRRAQGGWFRPNGRHFSSTISSRLRTQRATK
jgi:hypothetical protein